MLSGHVGGVLGYGPYGASEPALRPSIGSQGCPRRRRIREAGLATNTAAAVVAAAPAAS
jgi:hypothetical protein